LREAKKCGLAASYMLVFTTKAGLQRNITAEYLKNNGYDLKPWKKIRVVFSVFNKTHGSLDT